MKRIDGTGGNWTMFDKYRTNDGYTLAANLVGVEDTSDRLDITATGFKATAINGEWNTASVNYIYLAIAE